MSNPKQKSVTKEHQPLTSKRTWLVFAAVAAVGAAVAGVVWMAPPPMTPEEADVVVYKTASCACCDNWVNHLREHDLSVSVVFVQETQSVQKHLGVPASLGSCHTAKVGEYFVEGHVPADLVRQLLDERPEGIRGIGVPGMPAGSPGMEGPNPVEYQVMSVDTQGDVAVYATRQGQTAD